MRAAAAASIALVVCGWAFATFAIANETPRVANRLIVELRSEGPHAVRACAEGLHRSGGSFATVTADGSSSLDRIHDRLAVRSVRALFGGADRTSLRDRRARLNARLEARRPATASRPSLPDLASVYLIEIGDGVPIDEALDAFRADPHVVYAQPDFIHRLDDLPDDPFLSSSGAWGQPYEDLWGLLRIRAPEAWSISRGEGVVVAVVDTGIDYTHPDIEENVWVNPGEDLNGNGLFDASDVNGLDDDGNGFVDDIRGFDFARSFDADQDGDFTGPEDVNVPDPFDDDGHGTHVAGTIAAVADNGIGIAGVAPGSRIMALKGFQGGEGRDSDLWRAVLYAIENGADVVNNSWSCSPFCPVNPLAEEVAALARSLDVVIVTSAGNRRSDVVMNSPENTDDVITVGSTGQDDLPSATFTNFGFGVDVVAPGGGPSVGQGIDTPRRNILSLRASRNDESPRFWVGRDYIRMAGTSMSAPHVSGVVALLRSTDGDLDYDDIRRILRESAVDLGRPGPDRSTGAGRVDAAAAVSFGLLPDLRAAISSPRSGTVQSPDVEAIEVRGTADGEDLDRWSLRYGIGNEPDDWVLVAESDERVQSGDVLAQWHVSDLEPGTYVLRLDVEGLEGSHYEEFRVLSLERGDFLPLSSVGPPAASPAVSGSIVVWQSRRAPAPDGGWLAVDDLNLFATHLGTGAERAVQTVGDEQQVPSIAHGVVSWISRSTNGATSEVKACRLVGPWRLDRDCAAVDVAPGLRITTPPRVASGRVYWLDPTPGGTGISGCRLDRAGRMCPPESLGLAPGRRSTLGSDGKRLIWTELDQARHFATCRIDRRTGICSPTALLESVFALSNPAASGPDVAWVDFTFSRLDPLYVCRLDPETGLCPRVFVAEGVDDLDISMSGNRLVWDAAVGDEAGDVFFCEFDALRSECPVQRLTAHHALQRAGVIDGDWVVWEDERDGPTRVFGTRLPRLAPLRDRHVRVGERVWIPVRLAHGSGVRGHDGTTLAVRGPDGQTLESLGARFVDLGNGRGSLTWRPRAENVGEHLFTFSATTESELTTRQTIRITVDDGRWKRPKPGRARPWR